MKRASNICLQPPPALGGGCSWSLPLQTPLRDSPMGIGVTLRVQSCWSPITLEVRLNKILPTGLRLDNFFKDKWGTSVFKGFYNKVLLTMWKQQFIFFSSGAWKFKLRVSEALPLGFSLVGSRFPSAHVFTVFLSACLYPRVFLSQHQACYLRTLSHLASLDVTSLLKMSLGTVTVSVNQGTWDTDVDSENSQEWKPHLEKMVH